MAEYCTVYWSMESSRSNSFHRFLSFIYKRHTKSSWLLSGFGENTNVRQISTTEFQGVIELRPWPSFGSLPNDIADKYPSIDNSAYIFAQFLALNLCILEIQTTIGAAIDFDEIAVPLNGTTLDYATKEMTGTNVGALEFENNYVSMNPPIYTSDFSGVSSPTFYSKVGPQKVRHSN